MVTVRVGTLLGAWALLGIACRPGLYLATPPTEGAQTVVYLAVPAAGEPALFGARTEPGTVVDWEVERDGTRWALLYKLDAEASQLGPGPLLLLDRSSGVSGRSLPEPAATLRYDPEGAHWVSDDSKALRASLRLEPFDYGRCLAALGCAPADGAADLCALPCPVPQAPALPAPPQVPCPATWEVEAGMGPGGLDRCAPTAPEYLDCPLGQFQPAGAAACEPVGAECPAGPYPDVAGETRPVVYINAAAAPGGDGSLAAPFQDPRAAARAAAPGSLLVMAKGRYDLSSRTYFLTDAELRGACAAETQIWVGDQVDGVLIAEGGRLLVRDLSLVGGTFGVVASAPATSLTLDGVVLEGGTSYAVLTHGVPAELRRVSIRGRHGRGVVAEQTSVHFQDLVIEHLQDLGLHAISSTVTGEGLHLAHLEASADPAEASSGRGIMVAAGAHLSASRVLIEHCDLAAATASGTDTEAELSDVIIRDTGDERALSVAAVDVGNGARLRLVRALVDRSQTTAIYAGKGQLELEDVVIRDLVGPARKQRGLLMVDGSSGSVQRLRIERGGHTPLDVDAFMPIALSDVSLDGSSLISDNLRPSSVLLRGPFLTIDRILVDGGPTIGMEARTNPGMQLRDVWIRGVRGGLLVEGLGEARFERVLVEDVVGSALEIDQFVCEDHPCPRNDFSDLTIRGTRPDQLAGTGVLVGPQADLLVERFVIEGTQGPAVSMQGRDLRLSQGLLRGNLLGLEAVRGAAYLPRALATVRMEANQEDLRLSNP